MSKGSAMRKKRMMYKLIGVLAGCVLIALLVGAGILLQNQSASGSESELQSQSDSGNETESRAETESGAETESQAETESGTETESQAETESETAGDSEMDTDADTDRETESRTESETGTTDIVRDFSMFFTGDVMLKSTVMSAYDKNGINALISEYLEQEMLSADMTMINEEFPFSTRGTQAPNKQYTFRVDPAYVRIFHEMGVDVASLANNHSLDYGPEALLDTFETLDNAGIPYVGAGENRERAEAAIFVEANGRKIGVLSASRVIPVVEWNIENQQPGLFCTYSSSRVVKRIQEVEEECDFVVVYVHWGKERMEYPEEYQRELAQKYIDAGADLVVGSHPHVPQGIEYYKGVPIVYSLGNFIFNGNMVDTFALKAVFDAEGNTTLQVVPVGISRSFTSELTGEDALEFYDYLESISFGVAIDENGIVTSLSQE